MEAKGSLGAATTQHALGKFTRWLALAQPPMGKGEAGRHGHNHVTWAWYADW